MSKSLIELFAINKIREKRIQFGFSQAYLAELLGVSSGFIGKVESHKYPTKYNLNHLFKLAILFNCSPQEFLPSMEEMINEFKKD